MVAVATTPGVMMFRGSTALLFLFLLLAPSIVIWEQCSLDMLDTPKADLGVVTARGKQECVCGGPADRVNDLEVALDAGDKFTRHPMPDAD